MMGASDRDERQRSKLGTGHSTNHHPAACLSGLGRLNFRQAPPQPQFEVRANRRSRMNRRRRLVLHCGGPTRSGDDWRQTDRRLTNAANRR
jgi:hypothetical protein